MAPDRELEGWVKLRQRGRPGIRETRFPSAMGHARDQRESENQAGRCNERADGS